MRSEYKELGRVDEYRQYEVEWIDKAENSEEGCEEKGFEGNQHANIFNIIIHNI